MSTQAPFVPQRRELDLPAVRLEAPRERTSTRRGRIALGLLVLCGSALALSAAHSAPLRPESIRLGLPSYLGGAFYALGLNLHLGGVILALVVMFGAYVVVVGCADRLSARSVLMAIAVLDALVLLGPPLVSTDVFSYQAYARMGSLYGINPYTHGPYAIFNDPVFQYIGAKWSSIPSAYGPVFTVLTYVLASLSIAASVFTYKAVAATAAIGLVALIWRCAQLRGTNPVRAAALVGLNPLLVVYAIGGGHNDLLMLLALVGSLYAILRSHERVGGMLAVLAAGIKLTAGVVLPFALVAHGAGRGRSRRDLTIGAGLTIVALAIVSLEVFGAGSLQMLGTINKSQSEGGWQSLPGFMATRLHLVTLGHITGYVLAAAFVIVCAWLLRRVWRGQTDWLDGSAWAMLAMLVASSTLLPWYVAWLLPLAALGHDRRLVRWAVILTGAMQLVQIFGYVPHGTPLL